MAEIHIWADSQGRSECRSCRATIEWATNARTGRKIPFDGPIVPVRSYHDEETRRLILVIDPTVTISHFSSCPDASKFRKKGRT